MGMVPLLEIRNLSTYFYTVDGVIKAVDDVSYSLQAGESMGIVGESGSGKSVGALSVLRLVPYPGRIVTGEIMFQGTNLMSLGDREMRSYRGRRIGMIFQEPMTSLNPVLTIGRQLTEAVEAHLRLNKSETRKRAVQMLDRVGMSDPQKVMVDYPHMLSGGMRQRVMIAMALISGPDLIIADEPTTAVDVTIQAQLLELMKDMTREFNVALIIISHNMGILARYVDKVAVMYAGKIVETGSVIDIFKQTRHPYTLGLHQSIPRLDRIREEKLVPIPGQPPDLAKLPTGCVFRERCEYAVDRCVNDRPELLRVTKGHWSACWEFSNITGVE